MGVQPCCDLMQRFVKHSPITYDYLFVPRFERSQLLIFTSVIPS